MTNGKELYTKAYQFWLENPHFDEKTKTELKEIAADEKEIEDRFYRDLEFGTGGLRGVLGAGNNRMNIYTVRKATQGICSYLNDLKAGNSVAIAFDSRINSDLFAKEAAAVFAANGITAHIFTELEPTPVLSYAVRQLHCDAGVVITASHNPAKYNGYKVYGADGCQITLETAEAVLKKISETDIVTGVKHTSFESALQKGLIQYIPASLVDNFLEEVSHSLVNKELCEKTDLSVIYTPLNGTGNKPVRAILKKVGIKNVQVVPEQENPDGNFPTCLKPNPEERSAFAKALEMAEKFHPDLLVATDPDCDRAGIAVRDTDGSYKLMTGNETGCLLLDYVLSQRKQKGTLPEKPVVIKTIVTSVMADAVAKSYGAEVINVLTGFKFIGEQIGLLEQKGEAGRYVFGFEESYGYLAGTYARDKDAVVAVMLICEMAAWYKSQGIGLLQALDNLYKKYGYWKHRLVNFAFEGADGMTKMNALIEQLRENVPAEVAGFKVLTVDDYETSATTELATGNKTKLTLPVSNVLVFKLEGGKEAVIRPSGTEPKLKCYLTACADSEDSAYAQLDALEADIKKIAGL